MLKLLKRISVLLSVFLLSGCKMALLDPKGIIAASEKNLLVDATLLMLIVVIPVIILSFVFAFHFRAKNKKANYQPGWHHSNVIEAICWLVPCVIIGILATMTWISTHRLDPYRPLASKKQTLVIQVVALDWRWLFIYPKQNIATVDFAQIPVNVPVRFEIAADAPMNALQIPQLAGQIYAMPGMQTKLNILATAPGNYYGFSASYSGDGFAGMNFNVKVSSKDAFEQWVKKVAKTKNKLTIAEYRHLSQPTQSSQVILYSSAAPDLFRKIIEKYTQPNAILAQKMKGKRDVSIVR